MTAIVRTLHPRPIIFVAGVLAAVAVTASIAGILGDRDSLWPAAIGLVAGLATLGVADLARDRLLFEGGDAIRVVGATGALLAVPAGLLTLPATDAVAVERIAGADRIATSVAVSEEAFTAADAVVLVAATSPDDAVAAAALAADVRGPLLLTVGDDVPDAVAREIGRLEAHRAFVVGAAAASPLGESLRAAGVEEVVELVGADRYATSAAVVERIRPDRVLVTSSWEPALAAPLTAGDTALLATPSDHLSPRAIAALQRSRPDEVVVLGGEAAVSADVLTFLTALLPDADVSRAATADRWAQSLATFEASGHARSWPWVAAGDSWPDAVTAAVAASSAQRPLLLVPSRGSAPSVDTVRWLDRNRRSISEITVVGGSAAVPDRLIEGATR